MMTVNRIEMGIDERGEVWSSCYKQVVKRGERRRRSTEGKERKNNIAVRLQRICPSINGVPSGNSAERVPVESLGWLEFL